MTSATLLSSPPPLRGLRSDPARRQAAAARRPPADTRSPADRYEELFVDVQRAAVFADSKTFVDCAPLGNPEAILTAYRAERGLPGFYLAAFVARHFVPPRPAARDPECAPGMSLVEHIDSLWDELTRHPDQHPHRGSSLSLPHPYVVPGGRFVEMYYWDSYFTMLGLVPSGRCSLLHAMTDNFAYLIDTYGHVPNGTRTYYLSRSQPPVFALMAELCERCDGQDAARYLPQMLREHAFWMQGEQEVAPGEARARVVRLPDGALLNRYWDARDTPREEAWREDVATAAAAPGRPAAEVYRDVRAACESGWDFSSRWLDAAPQASRLDVLASICTTRILPVDLNALLHHLETTIAHISVAQGDRGTADAFQQRADARRAAMDRVLWDEAAGTYRDYDWARQRARTGLNAAMLTPLFTRTASDEQARRVAEATRQHLLAPGGLLATAQWTGEQWDAPNGWAPLHWIAVEGLRAYGCHALAEELRQRWLATVGGLFDRQNKLVEKYAMRDSPHADPQGGGGGEYPLQDGFGWTNAVTRTWLAETSITPH